MLKNRKMHHSLLVLIAFATAVFATATTVYAAGDVSSIIHEDAMINFHVATIIEVEQESEPVPNTLVYYLSGNRNTVYTGTYSATFRISLEETHASSLHLHTGLGFTEFVIRADPHVAETLVGQRVVVGYSYHMEGAQAVGIKIWAFMVIPEDTVFTTLNLQIPANQPLFCKTTRTQSAPILLHIAPDTHNQPDPATTENQTDWRDGWHW